MPKIAVIVTARPSWAKLQTLCEALQSRCDLQIIACASALLERYGRVVDVIRSQGFEVAAECYSVHEGETLLTSALETGSLCGQLSGHLSRLRPDAVVVCADRHEVLAAAQAAAYLHLPLAHLQGGERTGSIDDKVRNAITMLADLHFPATWEAIGRVERMIERPLPSTYGCPSIDLSLRAAKEPRVKAKEIGGAGSDMDSSLPLVVWLQHPVTNELADVDEQWTQTAAALERGLYDVLAFWPGQDAGADRIAKRLRRTQDRYHTVKNLPPMRFLKLLTQAACVVGNSSAGIRECSALGVPVVNIGTRQHGRERGPNVIDVPHDRDAIYAAIEQQIAHGPYPSSTLYGDGKSGKRIAEALIGYCGVSAVVAQVQPREAGGVQPSLPCHARCGGEGEGEGKVPALRRQGQSCGVG